MGCLIDKIRSWFCKHEWECLIEKQPVYIVGDNGRRDYPQYYQWIYVCKKCGCRKKITTE